MSDYIELDNPGHDPIIVRKDADFQKLFIEERNIRFLDKTAFENWRKAIESKGSSTQWRLFIAKEALEKISQEIECGDNCDYCKFEHEPHPHSVAAKIALEALEKISGETKDAAKAN